MTVRPGAVVAAYGDWTISAMRNEARQCFKRRNRESG